MTLDELFLSGQDNARLANQASVNPFLEPDALGDSQILDIRYDGVRSSLGIILELRVSELAHEGNTGLIVASNVIDFSWKQADRCNKRTAWIVDSSMPLRTDSGFKLELTAILNARLRMTAERASFYILRIPHLENTAPPDYGEPDFSLIRNSIATWDSEAEVVAAVHTSGR
jgi:hypothetical protein